MGADRVTVRVPSSPAAAPVTEASRWAYRGAARAALRESAPCWAVRGVPSENAAPGFRVKVHASPSPLTAADWASTGWGVKVLSSSYSPWYTSPVSSWFTWLSPVMGWREAAGS